MKAVIAGLAALAAAAAVLPAAGQGPTTGLTGVDKPGDVVQARQLVMDGIDSEMHDIDLAGTGQPFRWSSSRPMPIASARC